MAPKIDPLERDHATQTLDELDGHIVTVQVEIGLADHVRLDLALEHVVESGVGAHRDG